MYVVERGLLKRGNIKNILSNWDMASVVVERMLLKRGSRKGGSAYIYKKKLKQET